MDGQVRESLNLLKETWEMSKKSNGSIISYVLSIQEKVSEMEREDLDKAQKPQKLV